MLKLITLVAVLFGAQAHATMGGQNYDVGSYYCENDEGDVQTRFTFPTRKDEMTIEFTIKGKNVDLTCVPARESDLGDLQFLAKNFVRASNVCTGRYEKGLVIGGTTNSMGLVKFTAFLLGSDDEIKAVAKMSCDEANEPAPKNSGW